LKTNNPMLLKHGACWSHSVTEEYDHARHRECRPNRIQTPALEQG
jgi:hypothetical protein